MKEYVLKDRKGRILTDKFGLCRIWFNRKRAKLDAVNLSRTLGIKLRVVEYPRARWQGPISPGYRIEV